jgi:hypothetical protein
MSCCAFLGVSFPFGSLGTVSWEIQNARGSEQFVRSDGFQESYVSDELDDFLNCIAIYKLVSGHNQLSVLSS